MASKINPSLNVLRRRPAAVSRGRAAELAIEVFDTRLGWFAAAWRDQRLVGLSFGHADPGAARRALVDSLGGECWSDPLSQYSGGSPYRLAERLRAYAEGCPDDFLDVPLELAGQTDFQRRVSLACRQVAFGQTLSYAQLARRVGSPGAARAVGSVMARNRFPIIIPCHRVLGSCGRLGGYSAPGGLATKRRLLELEGSSHARIGASPQARAQRNDRAAAAGEAQRADAADAAAAEAGV